MLKLLFIALSMFFCSLLFSQDDDRDPSRTVLRTSEDAGAPAKS